MILGARGLGCANRSSSAKLPPDYAESCRTCGQRCRSTTTVTPPVFHGLSCLYQQRLRSVQRGKAWHYLRPENEVSNLRSGLTEIGLNVGLILGTDGHGTRLHGGKAFPLRLIRAVTIEGYRLDGDRTGPSALTARN